MMFFLIIRSETPGCVSPLDRSWKRVSQMLLLNAWPIRAWKHSVEIWWW